jgi:ATP-dependent DNA helicase RecG
MAVVDGPDEYVKPRNIGLLFFNETPEKFFPGTQIDLVQFPQGVGGSEIVEQTFRGPLHTQIRDCLGRLRNKVLEERVTKLPDRAESVRRWNYPYAALEEAIVNAVYHRGFDQREPIEVRVNPDGIEVVSYPGPDPSIQREQLSGKQIVARRYRNRRIGDFLKELELTEGRSTGIPKIRRAMQQNGSPDPVFDTDEGRTYFVVRLPIHPAFLQAADEAPVGGVVGTKAPVEARVEAPVKAPVKAPVGGVVGGVVGGAVEELSESERRVLSALIDGPLAKRVLLARLGVRKLNRVLQDAVNRLDDLKLIELTIPDKPNSSKQKRRLTANGRLVAASLPDRPPPAAPEE